MKGKAVAGLIAVIVISLVIIFVLGYVEEETPISTTTSIPTSAPLRIIVKDVTQLTTNSVDDTGSEWTPDGRIMYRSHNSNYEIWTMDATGGDKRLETSTPSDGGATLINPIKTIDRQKNPDGTKKVREWCYEYRYDCDICIVNSNCPDWNPKADECKNKQWLTSGPAIDVDPAWSPDGKKIVFLSKSNQAGNFDIWVMNSDGSNKQRLTTDPADDGWPSWSPDGSKIAFESNRSGNYDIYIMVIEKSATSIISGVSPDEEKMTKDKNNREVNHKNV